MIEYNLTFLELMRVVKEGDIVAIQGRTSNLIMDKTFFRWQDDKPCAPCKVLEKVWGNDETS